MVAKQLLQDCWKLNQELSMEATFLHRLNFKEKLINPLTTNDGLSRHENLTFL